MNMERISEFLKTLRKNRGLTQSELAEKLNVSNKTVSKWENGMGIPEMSSLLMLADFYHVSVDDILRGEQKIILSKENKTDINRLKTEFGNKVIFNILFAMIGLLLLFLLPDIVDSMLLTVVIASLIILGDITFYIITLRSSLQFVRSLSFEERESMYPYLLQSSLTVFSISLFVVINILFYCFEISLIPGYDRRISIILISAAITFFITSISILFIRYEKAFGIYVKKNIITLFLLLAAVTILPLGILEVVSPKKMAILTESNLVVESYSTKNDQYVKYQEMKFLALVDEYERDNMDATTLYELKINPVNSKLELHYICEDNYTLVLDYDWFVNELEPRYEMGFTITEEYASAKWFIATDDTVFNQMYLILTSVLFLIGSLGVVIFKSKKKG
ncbi:MAG: helix-turn-helix transcriptional regulator [Bacilli bacterium]|jgi:transcriptional regulator with XRE-family HTH domain|nr:helix-turn-helix transcriptional regulator [Bacilli bacterium]